MRKTSRVLFALLFSTALAGCGGESADPEKQDSKPPEAKTSKKPTACLTVKAAMLRGIEDGTEDDVSFELTRGAAIKSKDFEKVYFIAAEMQGDGLGDDSVGVWASNSLRPGGGIIMAIDGMAQQFTVWPDGDGTAAEISKADPAVDHAQDCLG